MNIEGGNKIWRNSAGQLHREDGPALETPYRGEEWYLDGQLHRTDGPAIDTIDFSAWYIHDKCHRLDGPAVEWEDGDKEWFIHDKRHRTDGPAIEYSNNRPSDWFFRDKKVSKSKVATLVAQQELKIRILTQVVNPFCEINVAKYVL
jgi:hypothetical protein